MAITSFDIELIGILKRGMDFVRANPSVLDDIFGNFKESPLDKLYGEQEVNNIKKWILTNEIPIKAGWNLQPTDIPCISIHLAQSQEDVPRAFFNDFGSLGEDPNAEPRIVLEFFIPANFDSTTGIVTIPDNLNLDYVVPGMIVVDNKREQYIIDRVIDDNTFQINILGNPVDASRLRVQSSKLPGVRRGEAYFIEHVDVGIHGLADQNTIIWMYWLVIYIMFKFRPELEKRCLDLTTFSASDFKKEPQYLGNNVYSRWVRISARTQITWEVEKTPAPIDGVSLEVSVDAGPDADPIPIASIKAGTSSS